jgi:hypothetical protein
VVGPHDARRQHQHDQTHKPAKEFRHASLLTVMASTTWPLHAKRDGPQ